MAVIDHSYVSFYFGKLLTGVTTGQRLVIKFVAVITPIVN